MNDNLKTVFWQCARASMETLTMARYILEMSLMEYEFIKYRESKMASACLLLAMKMKNAGEWVSCRVLLLCQKKKLGALSLFLALEEFLLFQVGMYEYA